MEYEYVQVKKELPLTEDIQIKDEIIIDESPYESDMDKRFPCDYCNASFETSTKRKTHEKTHFTRRLKSKCSICNKRFRNLKSHNKVHIKKEYNCTICKKSFMKLETLKEHCMTHIEKKGVGIGLDGSSSSHPQPSAGVVNVDLTIVDKSFRVVVPLERISATKLSESPPRPEIAETDSEPVSAYFSAEEQTVQDQLADEQKRRTSSETDVLQTNFQIRVLKFFVNSMLPLRLVEDVSFRQMFETLDIEAKGLKLVDEETLDRQMDTLFAKNKKYVADKVSAALDVCATVNVWCAPKRCLIGVTVHCINDNLERESFTVACRKLELPCSRHQIAEFIGSVRTKYGISVSKITASLKNGCVKSTEDCGGCYEVDQNLKGIVPKRLSCASHSLSSCASMDLAEEIAKCSKLQSLHQLVTAKCGASAPSTGQGWAAFHEALSDPIYPLSNPERRYVDEYVACTKPIVSALDILRGESYTHYGALVPTLLALRRKLSCLRQKKFFHLTEMPERLLASLNRRFGDVYHFAGSKSMDAAIAAFSHPAFKNKWLLCIGHILQVRAKAAFVNAVAAEMPETVTSSASCLSSSSSGSPSTDFFDFGDESSGGGTVTKCSVTKISQAELEILSYFADADCTLASLHKYPAVKKVFIKYNTPLHSLTPADRRFGFAVENLLASDRLLNDCNFEKKIVLKCNLCVDEQFTV